MGILFSHLDQRDQRGVISGQIGRPHVREGAHSISSRMLMNTSVSARMIQHCEITCVRTPKRSFLGRNDSRDFRATQAAAAAAVRMTFRCCSAGRVSFISECRGDSYFYAILGHDFADDTCLSLDSSLIVRLALTVSVRVLNSLGR